MTSVIYISHDSIGSSYSISLARAGNIWYAEHIFLYIYSLRTIARRYIPNSQMI
ncbi:hypothetical protein MITSMUL_03866 [Mitsuokella multacida DSM 20544]|uniref:Uncharacterized protein n=1 Tax=Mitsuokella multacida DSM 20544 TaxID=500635 RepID=C9KL13_9FIRM|nr:hypothetical protein MITSMUL_03866 [Mitsuokella multacida DSM 20544]